MDRAHRYLRLIFNPARLAPLFSLALTLAAILPTARAQAAPAERPWTLLDDDDGVKVYRRDVPGTNLYEFRGVGTVGASMAKIVAVLSDASKMPQWVDGCISGELVEKNYNEHDLKAQPTEQNAIFYAVAKAPWPLQNRDYVVRSNITFVQASASRPAGMTIVSNNVTHPRYPARDGLVRLPLMHSRLDLTPLGSGDKTLVDFSVVVDPGGVVPDMVINILSHRLPMKTLVALAELVKVQDYNRALETMVAHHFKQATSQRPAH